jgi:hypothetical protein
MSAQRNQKPLPRGIDWIAVERIVFLQVMLLVMLVAGFIRYVNWSSDVAFSEFSAASNRASIEAKPQGPVSPINAGERRKARAGST